MNVLGELGHKHSKILENARKTVLWEVEQFQAEL